MDMSAQHLQQIVSSDSPKPTIINPTLSHSVSMAWAAMSPSPIGCLYYLYYFFIIDDI